MNNSIILPKECVFIRVAQCTICTGLASFVIPYSPVIRRLCLCLHRKEMGA